MVLWRISHSGGSILITDCTIKLVDRNILKLKVYIDNIYVYNRNPILFKYSAERLVGLSLVFFIVLLFLPTELETIILHIMVGISGNRVLPNTSITYGFICHRDLQIRGYWRWKIWVGAQSSCSPNYVASGYEFYQKHHFTILFSNNPTCIQAFAFNLASHFSYS